MPTDAKTRARMDLINVLRNDTSRDEINVRAIARNKRESAGYRSERGKDSDNVEWVRGRRGTRMARAGGERRSHNSAVFIPSAETVRWWQELLYCIRGWRNDGNTT